MTRGDHPTRAARRSLVATLEITTAASIAHVLAGGHLPAAGFLFAFAALVFVCSLATVGRVLHVGVVVPFVLAAQIGLHALLDAAPMAHHPGMAATGSGMPDPASAAPLGLTPVMFWAHLVTALVTAIVLLSQERVLVAVAGWWTTLEPVPFAAARRNPAATSRHAGVRGRLLSISPRRGPPVGLHPAY